MHIPLFLQPIKIVLDLLFDLRSSLIQQYLAFWALLGLRVDLRA